MSEHHDAPKAHEPHALHEEHAKGLTIPKRSTPRWPPTSPTGRKSLASPATSSTKPSAAMEPTSKRSAPPFTLTKVPETAVSAQQC